MVFFSIFLVVFHVLFVLLEQYGFKIVLEYDLDLLSFMSTYWIYLCSEKNFWSDVYPAAGTYAYSSLVNCILHKIPLYYNIVEY